MTDYLQLARDVVKKAQRNGIESEALIIESVETEIRVDKGEVEQLARNNAKGLGVRVIDGGKVGYAYTSNFAPKAIDDTVSAALELAQIATPDPNRALPELQTIPDEDLEIYDPHLDSVTTDQKIALVKKSEEVALKADPRMILAQSNYGDYAGHFYLANSRGFAGSYSRTATYNYIIGVAHDPSSGDQAQAFGLAASTYYHDIDPQKVGQEAAYKTTMTLGAKPVKTQVASVVFDPLVMAELLAYISQALTAEAMQRGRSFLINKLGQEVGSDKVTLLDNARMKGGMSSAPFDGEGVPTSAVRLIDEGVFQNVIYDTYSARKDGVKSTGSAQRDSHRSLPRLGTSNFYIQPGPQSPEEIIGEVEQGLYVMRIMQTGGINPINGDCSMAASGMWIENGKLAYPVNGVTIGTTLPDLLRNVSAVGNDIRMVPFFGSIGAPTVRVDNMTIGGTD